MVVQFVKFKYPSHVTKLHAWSSGKLVLYIMQSSANKLDTICNIINISRKRMGPSTEPWSTPDVTLHEDDNTSFKTTCYDQSDKNDVNQLSRFPETL